ncbi:hypothetical protein ACFFX0_20115 [Citricoccus parietis]|uniref:Uncharacterized protein n=1 Tax=Citricoccus parietis TaxID=592307 RepID=A0ABV5G377_9MICC
MRPFVRPSCRGRPARPGISVATRTTRWASPGHGQRPRDAATCSDAFPAKTPWLNLWRYTSRSQNWPSI